MKVILLKDVPNVGKQQQVLDVKTGYANNFLLKKGLALIANDENMQKLNDQLAAQRELEEQIKQQAIDEKEVLQDKQVTLTTKSGPDGKLYGAVTTKDIAEAIKEKLNIEVDKRKIVSDSIKLTGTYTIKIKLHPDVEAQIVVIIESEE